MTKKEFEDIKESVKNIKEKNNAEIYSILEKMSVEFEIVKNSLLSLSAYLDDIESIYNSALKEYDSRNPQKK